MIELFRASPGDIPFIMSTERLAGYDDLVGRWSEARHAEAMADSRHAYFLARREGEAAGFVILRDWRSEEQSLLVKRVAVVAPGLGVGRLVMRAVADLVFTESDAWRLWLGVFPDNLRAQAAYRAAGFVPEGVARGSAFFGGVHRDELIMAMLRPDWLASKVQGDVD